MACAHLMTASTLPDRERALQLYKRLAAHYDRSLGIRLAGPVGRRALRALALALARPYSRTRSTLTGRAVRCPARASFL